MGLRYNIAGYARISFDDDLSRDNNVSIENQKSIIEAYVNEKFPGSQLTFYQDRDRSGYTFEQREGYQEMRPLLMKGMYDILIVKDFSRFSRRNSRGLVELEDLRDAGVRIISIGDSIDYPTFDDWVQIQFRFLVNEMPITDTSKKIKSVIKNREAKGEWICAAPYGYIIDKKKKFIVVPEEAEVVKLVFNMYINGSGYDRIARYLTGNGFPTPTANLQERMEADGRTYKGRPATVWSVQTIVHIITNDFYIGTLRQRKSTRYKINSRCKELPMDEHIVFEDDHEAIIDKKTFALAQTLREERTAFAYRGKKKYDHPYAGVLFCGDCGNKMASISVERLSGSYHCNLYHRYGAKACGSHYTRGDTLDVALKDYVRLVKDYAVDVTEKLNKEVFEHAKKNEPEVSTTSMEKHLEELKAELKATKRQRIKELARYPEREELIDETYDELEGDLNQKIENFQKQILLMQDKKKMAEKAKEEAKSVVDVFNKILGKEKLDERDVRSIAKKIVVYQDRIEVFLHSDIDALLSLAIEEKKKEGIEGEGNFNWGTNVCVRVMVKFKNHHYSCISVSVVTDGCPSFTTLTQFDYLIIALSEFGKRMSWL